jgi:hypothetical protein
VADTQKDVLESQQPDIVAFLQHLAARILGSDVRIDSWTLSLSGAARKRPFSLSAAGRAPVMPWAPDRARPFRSVTDPVGYFQADDGRMAAVQ